jgi:uncharacterized membrane protein
VFVSVRQFLAARIRVHPDRSAQRFDLYEEASTCKNVQPQISHPKDLMKKLIVLSLCAAFASFASVSHAAESACMSAAKSKKLYGAAQKSFVKKCEADAKVSCEASANEKKLAGAAKSSNVKKCVRETGPAA